METPLLRRRVRAVRARARTKAFTLIELLTVIAIIGILAAILIPTVGKVRSMAKKTQCVSNLRQWGTAVRLFANDYKGTVLLYNKDVDDAVLYSPYFGQKYMTAANGDRVYSQIFLSRCPVSAGLVPGDANFRSREYAFVRPVDYTKTYKGVNFGIADTNNIYGYNLADCATPSRLILMTEVHAADNAHLIVQSAPDFTTNVKAMQVNATNPGAVRHGGVANVLYLDGHVGPLSVSQTDYGVPANRPIILGWMTLKQ